jgi:hypothetical protein
LKAIGIWKLYLKRRSVESVTGGERLEPCLGSPSAQDRAF